jgi:hypothetical protein
MQTIFKWRIWLLTLSFLTGLTSFFLNKRRYPDRSPMFWLLKTIADTSLVSVLCAFPILTPLVVIFSTMWFINKLKLTEVPGAIAAFFMSMLLSSMIGRALEVILLLGVLSIDIVTGRFLKEYSYTKSLEK